MDVAMLAGSLSTAVFVGSTLPMLAKALRSRDLTSYSTGNLVLANVGNSLYSVYVFQLPLGPIWFLHGFYLLTSGLMLFWSRRFAPPARPGPTDPDAPDASTCPRPSERVGRSPDAVDHARFLA
jgi:hypothetical protein